MREAAIVDPRDCTQFRQTLLARPPAFVHGTVLLLAALLATALLWAAVVRANLVVRAPGRVRPVTSPKKVFNAGAGTALRSAGAGRVVAVHFREGDEVHAGDLLIRLDTESLDNDIARRKRTIQAGEEELALLTSLKTMLNRQSEAARAKGESELAQVTAEVRQARERQLVDVELARVELEGAEDELKRTSRLASANATATVDLVKARIHVRELKEKLRKAKLPVDDSKVSVVRRALELTERDAAVKQEELALKRITKQGEVESARMELANLELERKQAELRSPLSGVVTSGDVKVGDLLEAGKSVVEIAEQHGFHFEAEVPSTEVAHLRPGMTARIKLDAYDYQQYGTLSGTVCFISPDSGVRQGRGDAVYVVKIACDGDEVGRGELRGKVKLGMAGQVEIVTREESILTLMLRRIRQSISLG